MKWCAAGGSGQTKGSCIDSDNGQRNEPGARIQFSFGNKDILLKFNYEVKKSTLGGSLDRKAVVGREAM